MAGENKLCVDDCSAISCKLTLHLDERPTFLARLTLMLTLAHAEFLFLDWIPGARICPFQEGKAKAILPLENPFISSETHAHTTDAHRPRAVGGGSARGGPDAIKRGFLQKPARQPPLGSGGWVPSSLADTPSPKAQCVGEAPGGELLASPRDLVSGQAAPEVARAPQGAPRGGGSPSRPSPQVESVARRLMRAVWVCGVGGLLHP